MRSGGGSWYCGSALAGLIVYAPYMFLAPAQAQHADLGDVATVALLQ